MIENDGTIRWRVHLDAPRERVFDFLTTPRLRAHFWAVSAPDRDGAVEFHFSNGAALTSRVLGGERPSRFSLSWFDDAVVTFELLADDAGGTDLVLTEKGAAADGREDAHAAWGAVLLALKAAADHGIDLRNHDPRRTWNRGYIDG